jgi:hypothetical protein
MRFRGFAWGLLGALAVGAAFLFFALPERTQVQRFEDLPWQIEVLAADRTRVLGMVLGQTTLADLSGRRLPVPDIRLFAEADGTRSVEAFFSNARIPPFEANLVMVLGLDAAGLERIWNERTSERPMPSGARRYGLSDAALRELGRVPVTELSYIPRARWDPDLLRARFGEPASRIRVDDDQDYWLYPDRGLAIMVPTGRGRTLMHYVTLDRWAQVLARLERAGRRGLDDRTAGD